MAASSATTAAATLVRVTPNYKPSLIAGSSLPATLKCLSQPVKGSGACRALRQQNSSSEEEVLHVTNRRLALTLLAGVAAIAGKASPANAAYGEAANIFGKPKRNTDYIKYNGDGFTLEIPSKWSPSKEIEYPGQVLRYEDNFDSNSNVAVMVIPTDKNSIKDYGPPEKFLSEVDYLLGKQAFFGKTVSEGGFDADAVATASILEANTTNVNGKDYYNLNVLTRTADGDEGGKHQLIIATVKDGKLYMCKVQAGDKRWFKGAKRFVEGTASSFSVA